MNKYRFTIIFDKELTHEEVNQLEIALCAQCEDIGFSNAQLIAIDDRKSPKENLQLQETD